MKKLLLFMVVIVPPLLFWSCSYNGSTIVTVAEEHGFSVEKAKNIYETFYAERYTRSNIDERLPFVLGDATWLWDSANVSHSGDRSAVDVPVSGGFAYKVYKKSQAGEYIAVPISSKVVAVQDALGNTSFYIRVSIPDIGENGAVTQTLNFEDRNGYNGLEYYITIDGCPIAIAKFENGTQIDGVFLDDPNLDIIEKYCRFAYLLGDIAIARISSTTRSEMIYGKVGEIFYDQFGNMFVYVDTGTDGIADAVCPLLDGDLITIYRASKSGSSNSSGGDGSSGSGTSSGTSGSSSSGTSGNSSGIGGGVSSGAGGSVGGNNTTTGGSSSDGSSSGDGSSTSTTDITIEGNFPSVGSMPFVDPLQDTTAIHNLGVNTLPELLSIEQAKEYILTYVKANGIKQFIQNCTIPLRVDNNNYRTRTLLCDGTLGYTIYYNPKYFELLSNAGRILALFHEYMHAYLNSDDHVLMLDNFEYQQALRYLFPGMPFNFYEKIQYAGCDGIFTKDQKRSGMYSDVKGLIWDVIYKNY